MGASGALGLPRLARGTMRHTCPDRKGLALPQATLPAGNALSRPFRITGAKGAVSPPQGRGQGLGEGTARGQELRGAHGPGEGALVRTRSRRGDSEDPTGLSSGGQARRPPGGSPLSPAPQSRCHVTCVSICHRAVSHGALTAAPAASGPAALGGRLTRATSPGGPGPLT